MLQVRKYQSNPLLSRRQFVVDVLHEGKSAPSKAEIAAELTTRYGAVPGTVVLFGFRTQYGGGKSTGFGLIYDTLADLKKFEPKYRQVRLGVAERVEQSRKQIKELKNRRKKVRGKAKVAMA
ncbi:MAG: hypothetical protein MHM6MM_008077 [Cercozoa sp. M6MM]